LRFSWKGASSVNNLAQKTGLSIPDTHPPSFSKFKIINVPQLARLRLSHFQARIHIQPVYLDQTLGSTSHPVLSWKQIELFKCWLLPITLFCSIYSLRLDYFSWIIENMSNSFMFVWFEQLFYNLYFLSTNNSGINYILWCCNQTWTWTFTKQQWTVQILQLS
jgi:hypothetical protein